jgi:hypothetical protein
VEQTASRSGHDRTATPLGVPLRFEAGPERTEGRVGPTGATGTADGGVTAEGTGVLVEVGAARYRL